LILRARVETPLEPNAGPIGGAGLAAPPFTCNLMLNSTSFAMQTTFYKCDSEPIFFWEANSKRIRENRNEQSRSSKR
jgi:hypothetical protein